MLWSSLQGGPQLVLLMLLLTTLLVLQETGQVPPYHPVLCEEQNSKWCSLEHVSVDSFNFIPY